MNMTLNRRLGAVEAKLIPKISQHELRLLQSEAFVALLSEYGVSVEDFKRKGLGSLPRALLRMLVERLKVANAAG